MGQETNAALRRKLRTLRLPKQDVHDALTRYEFAAAAEGEDYVLSYRERRT